MEVGDEEGSDGVESVLSSSVISMNNAVTGNNTYSQTLNGSPWNPNREDGDGYSSYKCRILPPTAGRSCRLVLHMSLSSDCTLRTAVCKGMRNDE